ncbi:MAG: arsenate reductase ArsC [Methanomicrobiales archaeon]|nr:arsenate reductase ArsC [Methanomicrobiales archaeon]
MRKRALFICTHNAARSQMAEGYLRAKYNDRFDAFSAGTVVSTVSPYAIRAMLAIGIDISQQRSKSLDEFEGKKMDIVVTVRDRAKAACPFFPGAKKTVHMSFPDPKEFTGSDEEVLEGFCKVRDEIIGWIDATFGQVDAWTIK